MNKIVSTKSASAIFLAIVLFTGTITSIFSSSFMIMVGVQAESEDELEDDKKKSYGKDNDESYKKDNYYESPYSLSYKQDYKPEYLSYAKPYYQPDYKPAYPSHEKDNNYNNYHKSTKYNSVSNVDVNKIKCNNINVNINGGSSGLNASSIHESFGSGLTSQAPETEEVQYRDIGANTFDNNEKRFGSYDDKKKDFVYNCVNNNDNEQIKTKLPPSIEGATISINKDWFVCNNEDIDCTIERQEETEETSFHGPRSGNYTECSSEQDCPFVNDAGFNIEITGNDPIPNTVPAQVNTIQQIDIRAGPFEVTEELFSDELVPDANFGVQNVPVGGINAHFSPSSPILSFDEAGQRVFTANFGNSSISIIDLSDNNVTNVPLAPSGGINPAAIVFDEAGQRVFTANVNFFGLDGGSISIIDLANANNVTNVPLAPSGGDFPIAIAFDDAGQRVFTANIGSNSISIIDLNNPDPNTAVTNVPLAPSGGGAPRAVAFDETGQRVFTSNIDSDSVSIIDLTTTPITVTNVPLAPSGGLDPVAIVFDETGQRVFTANADGDSISIIDLNNPDPNTAVTNVPLAPSGGDAPVAIVFDETGQRVFTANAASDSVSILDLNNPDPNTAVTNVDLAPSGGLDPVAIVFDETGQRVFTANAASYSVSIITDLNNPIPTVTDISLAPSGAVGPISIVFDETGQRVFTANAFSSSVSIIDLLSTTVEKICQDSGFDTGDIRTFASDGRTIQQITCVNFVGECSGNIEDDEIKECNIQDYVVKINEISNAAFNILADSNKAEQLQQEKQQEQKQLLTKMLLSNTLP